MTTHVTSAVFHADDCYGFYTLHWAAADECDNHATATQVIDIFDTTPPTVTITCPSDTTVYSDAELLNEHDEWRPWAWPQPRAMTTATTR